VLLGRRVWGRVCFRRWADAGRTWVCRGPELKVTVSANAWVRSKGTSVGVGVGAVQVEDDAFRVGQVGERAYSQA
jgi:hypothetical protein